MGLPLLAAGWAVMWGVVSYWNPLAFAMLWTGAAVVMWGLSRHGYPGMRRHLVLAALSVPLWWWFELVNARAKNWHYIYEPDYSPIEFAVLSSMAFATVIPAVMAAYSLVRPLFRAEDRFPPARNALWRREVLAGVFAQALVFAFPRYFFPLEWVAPFLMIDGLVARSNGASLLGALMNWSHGRWRDPLAIGLAGLLCGGLWEFWNYWSSPHWEYAVPFVGFWKVFEMPLLGYGGYIPFAWAVVQLTRLIGTGLTPAVRSGSLRPAPPVPPP